MTKQLPRPFIPKPLKHSITLNLGAGGTKLKIMKKLFTMMAICLGAFTAANAQYTPEKGDFAVEFGFTPFGQNGNRAFNLNGGMLKGRYFLSDKDAIRLKLGLEFEKTTSTETVNWDPTEVSADKAYQIIETTTTTKDKHTNFSIMVGYERHLVTKGRFDVYAGLELGYMMDKWGGSETIESTTWDYDSKHDLNYKLTESSEYTFTNRTYSGNPTGTNSVVNGKAETVPVNTSFNSFVGNLFAGVDFYVYKQLYLGAEFGLGFKTGKSPNFYYDYTENTASYDKNGVVTATRLEEYDGEANKLIQSVTSGGSTNVTTTVGAKIDNEETTTSFKFFVEPAIRIGWTF